MRTNKRDPLPEISDHPGPIQVSNKTKLNRHPFVFSCVKDVVAASGFGRPQILSFGCSTGEEAHTLASTYFPDATVLGVDVSPEVIAAAQATYGAMENVEFHLASERPLAPGSFDVIFAMSVLCRWPSSRHMESIAELYPFSAYEQHVEYLDSLLKPGGIMVIFNASYSFLLSRVSRHYDTIADPRLARGGTVKRFRRNGRAYAKAGGIDCIYLKQPEPDKGNDECLVIRDHRLQQIAVVDRDLAIR